MPTLRAATAIDAVQSSYYAPDRMFHLKGDPVPVPAPKPARDEVAEAVGRLEEADQRAVASLSYP
jgi:hypothetical protein